MYRLIPIDLLSTHSLIWTGNECSFRILTVFSKVLVHYLDYLLNVQLKVKFSTLFSNIFIIPLITWGFHSINERKMKIQVIISVALENSCSLREAKLTKIKIEANHDLVFSSNTLYILIESTVFIHTFQFFWTLRRLTN